MCTFSTSLTNNFKPKIAVESSVASGIATGSSDDSVAVFVGLGVDVLALGRDVLALGGDVSALGGDVSALGVGVSALGVGVSALGADLELLGLGVAGVLMCLGTGGGGFVELEARVEPNVVVSLERYRAGVTYVHHIHLSVYI